MHEKIRFALRRSVTVSNLLESLAGVYGEREAFLLDEPLGCKRFPHACLTYGDGILFTNLMAEALIRDHDLKKGERVLLMTPDPAELILLAIGIIKAGGMVVPLDHRLPLPEIAHRASGCMAELALIDGKVLEERDDLPGNIPGVDRLIASGPRGKVPGGLPSLDEAMDRSCDFFLPYTLKPSSVVGLFHTGGTGGSSLAVMATNQGFLGIRHTVSPVLPAGPGDRCFCTIPTTSLSGFSHAMLGLCMGMCLSLQAGKGPGYVLEALQNSGASVFVGDAGLYRDVLEDGTTAYDLSAVRLWVCAGGGVPRECIEAFLASGPRRRNPFRPPSLFVETHDIKDSTTMVTFKPSLPGLIWPRGSLGITLPPNRFKVVDEAGRKVKPGGQGEFVIKGPAVTPGYWNNLDEFFKTTQNGWLSTGIRATRGWFFHKPL
jgi:acyl-coenzyme A synthetase/AMP-(fatty) acid ligase